MNRVARSKSAVCQPLNTSRTQDRSYLPSNKLYYAIDHDDAIRCRCRKDSSFPCYILTTDQGTAEGEIEGQPVSDLQGWRLWPID